MALNCAGWRGEQHPAEQGDVVAPPAAQEPFPEKPQIPAPRARQLISRHRHGLGKGLRGKAFKLKLFTAPRLMGSQQRLEMGQTPQLRRPYSLAKVIIRLLKTGVLG